MTRPLIARALTAAGWAVGAVALVGLLLAIGAVLPHRPAVGLAAALAILAFGLTLAEPAVIPLMALPVLLVTERLGSGSIDLSFSDFGLAIAFWPAVFLAPRPFHPALRTLLWLNVLYQASTLFAVLANLYPANVIEWFHAWLLVSGALLVGWVVGRRGHLRLGINLLFIAAGVIAAATIVQGSLQYASGDFSPVYTTWPFSMQKNFTGTVLAMVAVVAYIHPRWLRWHPRFALAVFWTFVLAILFSQSRQAVIGLAAALLLVILRTDPDRKRSKIILLLLAPAMVLVAMTVKEQISSGNEFNSYFQRLSWLSDAVNIWQHDPLFGVGLRWWYTDRFPVRFQPPNAEIEVLTTVGVVGLAGFLAMMIGALLVLRRLDPRYGTVALAVVLSRFVQTQFDLFWVAAQTSIPFVIAGMCIGAVSANEAGDRSDASEPDEEAPDDAPAPRDRTQLVGVRTHHPAGVPTRGAWSAADAAGHANRHGDLP